MTGGGVDTVASSALWDEQWPGCAKLRYALRGVVDRWVRFHTLPGSKRYPESEAEYGIVLARHNTVLAELVTGSAVLVVTVGYSDAREPQEPGRSRENPGGASGCHVLDERLYGRRAGFYELDAPVCQPNIVVAALS